jgi:hypothetical protein
VLDEAERPGADGLGDLPVAGGVDDLLGVDGGAAAGAGEPVVERARGLLQVEDHGVRILGLHRLDVGEHDLARRRDAAPARQRGHHVGGGHLLAVVEPDALAQPDGVHAPALADGVALGEHRDRREALVERVQRLVDVPGDLLGDDRRGGVQVERRRLADHRGLQHAAGSGLLLGPGASHEDDDGGEDEDGEGTRASKRSSHGGDSFRPVGARLRAS